MKPRDIFLKALAREPTPRPATGSATSVVTVDLMRKTGVFFPEAHLDPGKMAALAAAGATEIGFDNVMPLFSVFHESEAMGCDVDWGQVDLMPTQHGAPYRIDDEITIPDDLLDRRGCTVPLEALRMLKAEYGDGIAIVGKVFGPWTLGYHMFGVQEFLINTLLAPDAIRRAMTTLKEVTVRFALAQIDAGADALCLADHATRDLCSPDAYRDFLKDIHAELAGRIPCPLILHICGDTSDRIPYSRETGLACFHFDSKVPTRVARDLAGGKLALMGGTSNLDVIRTGTPESIRADVAEKASFGIEIIGPECAVPLDAPWRNMKLLADEVKKLEAR
ncbi:MAG TPA: uroporphyrinogen decarboxylase family protein [Planctomycetota bacterium]|nr:uroporphyrinogen decarboxylase family protein [Planctomycetota bacterium]